MIPYNEQEPLLPNCVLELARDANVPERFIHAHLAEGGDKETQEVLQEYLVKHQFNKKGHGLVLAGDTGSGKTHLACALINETIRIFSDEREVTPHFFNVNTDLPKILDMRYFRNYDSYAARIRKATMASLLVVDDLLHVQDYPQALEVLYRIYEERYERCLPTITTLNAKHPLQEKLNSRFNDPFVRRLLENAHAVLIV